MLSKWQHYPGCGYAYQTNEDGVHVRQVFAAAGDSPRLWIEYYPDTERWVLEVSLSRRGLLEVQEVGVGSDSLQHAIEHYTAGHP